MLMGLTFSAAGGARPCSPASKPTDVLQLRQDLDVLEGLLPLVHPVYGAIWQCIMPLAAALYLLEADLRECVLDCTQNSP